MTALLADGMGAAPGALVLDGMAGEGDVNVRDHAQKEFFHALPMAIRSSESIVILAEDIEPGQVVDVRQRGAGQFGIFRKATSDQVDWKLSVYADSNRTELLAEFEG